MVIVVLGGSLSANSLGSSRRFSDDAVRCGRRVGWKIPKEPTCVARDRIVKSAVAHIRRTVAPLKEGFSVLAGVLIKIYLIYNDTYILAYNKNPVNPPKAQAILKESSSLFLSSLLTYLNNRSMI